MRASAELMQHSASQPEQGTKQDTWSPGRVRVVLPRDVVLHHRQRVSVHEGRLGCRHPAHHAPASGDSRGTVHCSDASVLDGCHPDPRARRHALQTSYDDTGLCRSSARRCTPSPTLPLAIGPNRDPSSRACAFVSHVQTWLHAIYANPRREMWQKASPDATPPGL
jgi:hypothetical protein